MPRTAHGDTKACADVPQPSPAGLHAEGLQASVHNVAGTAPRVCTSAAHAGLRDPGCAPEHGSGQLETNAVCSTIHSTVHKDQTVKAMPQDAGQGKQQQVTAALAQAQQLVAAFEAGTAETWCPAASTRCLQRRRCAALFSCRHPCPSRCCCEVFHTRACCTTPDLQDACELGP